MGHSYDRSRDRVYHSLLLLGSHSCHWRRRLNRILVPSCSAKVRREEMDSVLTDGLLIFGGLVILLAPLTLAIAETGPWRCKIDASGRLWPCRSPTLTAPSSMPRSLPPPHGQTKSPDTAPGSFWRSPRRLAGHRVFDYADNACDDGACYAAADGLAFLNT